MNFAEKLYYTSIARTVRVKSLAEGEPLVLHKASKIKKKINKQIISGLPESISGTDVTENIRTM